MENALEFIKYAATVIIAAAIISYILRVSGIGEQIFNQSTKEMTEVTGSIQYYLENIYYTGDEVTGAQVLDAIDMFRYSEDYNYDISIQTKAYAIVTKGEYYTLGNYDFDDSGNPSKIYMLSDSYFWTGQDKDAFDKAYKKTAYNRLYVNDGALRDPECACYINPESLFVCEQVTENGTITGFRFMQE